MHQNCNCQLKIEPGKPELTPPGRHVVAHAFQKVFDTTMITNLLQEELKGSVWYARGLMIMMICIELDKSQ